MFEYLISKVEGHTGVDTTATGSSNGPGPGLASSSPVAAVDTEALDAATEQAWETYRYFVTPGASLEVSCHHLLRKHIMLQMGK